MYAELVKNRDMSHTGPPDEATATAVSVSKNPPPGWVAHGAAEIARSHSAPLNQNNTHCLQITAHAGGGGARNTGYWGMAVRAGEIYKLSLYARSSVAAAAAAGGGSVPPPPPPPLQVALLAEDGQSTIGSTSIDLSGAKHTLFEPYQDSNRSFYQDRLGTNMGKVEKKGRSPQATASADGQSTNGI